MILKITALREYFSNRKHAAVENWLDDSHLERVHEGGHPISAEKNKGRSVTPFIWEKNDNSDCGKGLPFDDVYFPAPAIGKYK